MKYASILATAAIVLAVSSCREEQSNTGHIEAMKDSISVAYPTVIATTIDVEASSNLIVVLGDKQMYNITEAERMQKANELGQMAMRIFGKNNSLEHGKLILTKDERNISLTPADAKTSLINLDSIRIEMAKGNKNAHVPGV